MLEQSGNQTGMMGMMPAHMELSNTLRRLWMEHVFWTRLFIQSTLNTTADLDDVTARLLRNPTDFAAVLRPLYGNQAAAQFESLLRDHLTIAAQLVNAVKAGDANAYNAQRLKWYANADALATFLAEINPYWNMRDWQKMLYDHLYMTEEEVMQYAGKDYAASIRQFDDIQREALEMADMMATGIMRQFP